MSSVKYRIIKRDQIYIPQERVLWFFWSGWMDVDNNHNLTTMKFNYVAEAEEFIKQKICEKRDNKFKSDYIRKFDKNGRLL